MHTDLEHRRPVLSLKKVKGCELAQVMRRHKGKWLVEPKVDGVAVVVSYQAGGYVAAATRGNGRIGRDVTEAMRGAVPEFLTDVVNVDVVGEAYTPRRLWPGDGASSRHYTAGSLRMKDTTGRGLAFVAHGVFDDSLGRTFSENKDELRSLGLRVLPDEVVTSARAAREMAQAMWDERDRYAYDIDGVVVKVDSLAAREKLGATSHHPHWACALKFYEDTAETTVKRIKVSRSSDGREIPVATVQTVTLGRTEVSSVSLNSVRKMEELGVVEGCRVQLRHAGGVIPQVAMVLR